MKVALGDSKDDCGVGAGAVGKRSDFYFLFFPPMVVCFYSMKQTLGTVHLSQAEIRVGSPTEYHVLSAEEQCSAPPPCISQHIN